MNPYAKYLDGRDVLDILAATPTDLQAILAPLSPQEIDAAPAPGVWSIREILAHMADCEIVWAFRVRQALESPGTTVTPFDQEVWATRYAAYSVDDALRVFLANRTWNLALLTTVSAAERSNLLTHPERGTFPLQELLEMIAGHDLNHITRLRERLG